MSTPFESPQRLSSREPDARNAAEQIVFILDLAGTFRFLNGAGERLCGYSCEEARRMNIMQLATPKCVVFVRELIQRSFTHTVGGVFEIEIITKEGRRVALEISTHLVAQDGQPVAIHGIALPLIGNVSSVQRAGCVDEDFSFCTL